MCDMIHLPPGPLRAANRSYRLGTRAHTLRVPGPAIGDGTGGSSSYRFRAGNAFSDTRPGSALRETRQRLVCRPSGTRRCRDVSYSTARRCRLPFTVAAATTQPTRLAPHTLPIHFAAMKWKCPKADCPPTDIPLRDVTSFEDRRLVAKWVNTFNRRARQFR